MAGVSEIGPYVTASSVMLGAFGFFYGAVKERIDAGHSIGAPAADPVAWRRQLAVVRGARTSAWILGGVALLVWLLLLKAVVDEVRAAWDIRFSLRHYQALDVVFVMLATAWLVIGVLLVVQGHRLSATLRMLERAKPREMGVAA